MFNQVKNNHAGLITVLNISIFVTFLLKKQKQDYRLNEG